MNNRGKNVGLLLTGMALGAALCGGAAASGIVAVPTWQLIYVDGRQVEMEAYNINGNNYVKLRDAGRQVGFNVYWDNGVQVDTDAPYTGAAPEAVTISSYKGNTLAAGDRSGLIINNAGANYTVTSSDPSVLTVEQVSGSWVVVPHAPGAATVTVTGADGSQGRLTLTVTASVQETPVSVTSTDLAANLDIREEMIRLVNQVRQEHGVSALLQNQALMDAAQICSAQRFTTHHNQFECETAMACGYPHGFGSNLTVFTGGSPDIAAHAVQNWVNSPGHFQTMLEPEADGLGVGVTQVGGATCSSGNPIPSTPMAHDPQRQGPPVQREALPQSFSQYLRRPQL